MRAFAELDRAPGVALVVGVTLFIILATASALTKLPSADEAWFASPGLDLITKGRMTTSVLEHAGTWHSGMERYTYWLPPLHFLVTAGWFKIFGFGILPLRALSVGWGLLALISWYIFISKLLESKHMAAFVTSGICLDYFFLLSASDGRMDIMCHALNVTAMAAYVALRESRLRLAILVSQSLVVASGLTHPNGLIGMAAVGILALAQDRKRIRLADCLVGAVPYVAGAVGWGLYIAQEPRLFTEQFLANARVAADAQGVPRQPFLAPLVAVKAEIRLRYLSAFGLGPGVGIMNRAKGVILIAYCAGLLGTAASALREHDRRRGLLAAVTAAAAGLLVVTPSKKWYYLVHVTPFLAACWCVWLYGLVDGRRLARALAMLVAFLVATVQVAGLVYRIQKNELATVYLPAITCVEKVSPPGVLVMGDATLFFRLWPRREVIDDIRLGYDSGKQPTVIVTNPFYRGVWHEMPYSSTGAYIDRLLREQFVLQCHNEYFYVYSR